MKTFIHTCLAALLFSACHREDAPSPSLDGLKSPLAVKFQIINKSTGKDLFLNNSIYVIDSVKVFHEHGVKENIPWQDPVPHMISGDSTILWIPRDYWASEKMSFTYLLQLTPNDFDTIAIHTESKKLEPDTVFNLPMAELRKFTFHYNGKLIEELNIEEDKEALQEMIVYEKGVILVHKEAEEDSN